MRGVGRHWPKSAPRGDYSANCDLCGTMFRRSQLTVVPGNKLRCSGSGTLDCARERTKEELDELNAQGSVRMPVMPIGGEGPYGSFQDD